MRAPASRRSAHATHCRCWSAARCCTSRPCSTGSTRCRPPTRRCAPRSTRGWPALHAELAQVDPATAARLAPNDAQRIQRALEVWRSTGRPLSSFHQRDAEAPSAGPAAANLISLEPADRGWLHERIAQRFDAMLAAGFVDEVRALRARGDLHAELPSMRCVGYRQAWEALDAGELAPLRERGIAATRQLAKRQLTWLRSMPTRHVVACETADAAAQVTELARRLWWR
jgi:tRNA dimethylallyltransferase